MKPAKRDVRKAKRPGLRVQWGQNVTADENSGEAHRAACARACALPVHRHDRVAFTVYRLYSKCGRSARVDSSFSSSSKDGTSWQ